MIYRLLRLLMNGGLICIINLCHDIYRWDLCVPQTLRYFPNQYGCVPYDIYVRHDVKQALFFPRVLDVW